MQDTSFISVAEHRRKRQATGIWTLIAGATTAPSGRALPLRDQGGFFPGTSQAFEKLERHLAMY
jgi:hypothetical protein